MSKIESKLKNYLEENQKLDEKAKKTEVIKTAATKVANNLEQKLRGNTIKKPIVATLEEDYGADKKEAERVADMILSAFLREDDEYNIENIMQKLVKRYMRGM